MASPLTELDDVIKQFNGRMGDAVSADVNACYFYGNTASVSSSIKCKYASPYLSRTPRKYATDSTSKSLRDMSLLGATQETDAVVQLLKKRLREKTKSETSLIRKFPALNLK